MGHPPARSKILRKQTKAYAEAKDDKPADAEVKVEGEAKPETKAEAKPEDKPDAKPEDKAEAKLEAKSDVIPAELVPPPAPIPAAAVEDAIAKGSTAEAMGMAPPSKALIDAANMAATGVESPASLPGPKDIPTGDPGDPAPAPGRVPPGDSRSLRWGNLFALIYRQGTFLITRSGTVGCRGVWKVVEYPTTASASNGYAKEASRFVSEGFTDYRD